MKRKLGMFALLFALATLGACGNGGSSNAGEETAEVQPLAVELTVAETADINEPVKMEAVVTQGEEKIEDADEVEFEVWEEGKKEDSIKIKSENEKDGLYTAETAFENDGVYTIQVHVTARNMHTMPTKVVTVGSGEKQAEKQAEEHAHGNTEGFSMHFMNLENAVAKEESTLTTHLQMEGQPLEKVNVRYEIWNEATPDKHDWVDTEETKAGEYTAKFSFAQAGEFKVQIHVKDDDGLHEHEEHSVKVN